jgi:hypothetical protein
MMDDSPLATAPEPPPGSSTLQRRWPLLAVVLALHLMAILLFAFVIEVRDDGRMIMGLLFGQIALLAMWTVWAPLSLFLRLASGLLAMGVVTLSLAMYIVRDSRSPDEGFVFGVILFGQWIAAQTPLWLARIAWGQRLAFSDSNHSGSRRRELQFGLSQLLGLTACLVESTK